MVTMRFKTLMNNSTSFIPFPCQMTMDDTYLSREAIIVPLRAAADLCLNASGEYLIFNMWWSMSMAHVLNLMARFHSARFVGSICGTYRFWSFIAL